MRLFPNHAEAREVPGSCQQASLSSSNAIVRVTHASTSYTAAKVTREKFGKGNQKAQSGDPVRGSHPLAGATLRCEEWKYRDLWNCGQGCVRT
jgi:hypothetical protein